MAFSGHSAPQFTTIAKFVRELGDEAGTLVTQLLLVCDRRASLDAETEVKLAIRTLLS